MCSNKPNLQQSSKNNKSNKNEKVCSKFIIISAKWFEQLFCVAMNKTEEWVWRMSQLQLLSPAWMPASTRTSSEPESEYHMSPPSDGAMETPWTAATCRRGSPTAAASRPATPTTGWDGAPGTRTARPTQDIMVLCWYWLDDFELICISFSYPILGLHFHYFNWNQCFRSELSSIW